MRHVFSGLLAAAVAVAAYATPASADLIYTLNAGAFSPGPFGTVELSQDGTNRVKVEVDLAPGVGFVNTGAGKPLLFNITGNPAISITNLTSPFGIGNTASGDSIHTGGAGNFEYDITCGTNACGTGGNQPNRGPLEFDVTALGLTPEDFDSNGTAFFAADICRDVTSNDHCLEGNNTGVVYAGGPPTTEVPEPAALLILSAGLAGLGVMRRRAA